MVGLCAIGALIANSGAHWGIKINNVSRYSNTEQKHSFLEMEVELDSGEKFIVNFDPWATNKKFRYAGLREDFNFYNENSHHLNTLVDRSSGGINMNSLAHAKEGLRMNGKALLEEAKINIPGWEAIHQGWEAINYELPRSSMFVGVQSGFAKDIVYVSENDPPCPVALKNYLKTEHLDVSNLARINKYDYLIQEGNHINFKENTIYIERINDDSTRLRCTLIVSPESEPATYEIGFVKKEGQMEEREVVFEAPLTREQIAPYFQKIKDTITQRQHMMLIEKNQNEIFAKIQDKLPEVVSHWRQFCSMYRILRPNHKEILFDTIYNNPESHKAIFSGEGFTHVYKLLSKNQQDLLNKEVVNNKSLPSVTSDTPEGYADLYKLDLQSHLDLIKSTLPQLKEKPLSFLNKILKLIEKADVRVKLFDEIGPYLSEMKGTREDYMSLYNEMKKERESELFLLLKEKSGDFIKSATDFQGCCSSLTEEQKNELFVAIKEKIITDKHIQNTDDFNKYYRVLNKANKEELFSKLMEKPKNHLKYIRVC